MRLTAEQITQYRDDGMLLVPDVFSPEETARLMAAFQRDSQITGDHLITEDRRRKGEEDVKLVRAVYGSHQRQPLFADMARDPRLLEPVRQLLAPDVYVYQFKINAKAAFGGEKWAWHQDYLAWKIADGLPAPRLVNVAVFLDEVNEFNGPVVYVPGSHRGGLVSESRRSGEQRSKQHVDPYDIAISDQRMTELVQWKGLSSPKGRGGTILFFHPELVHGSSQNMSPFPRTLLIVTYNDVHNLPQGPPRPEYVVCRDSRPLRPLDGPLCPPEKA